MPNNKIVLVYSKRSTSWPSTYYYPFFLGVACFMVVLYKFFPSLLLSSFPLIVCTMLFLGILLSYVKPNPPKKREDDLSRRSSSHKTNQSAAKDVQAKNDRERFKLKGRVSSRRTFKGMAIRTDSDDRSHNAGSLDNEMVATPVVPSNSSLEEDSNTRSLIIGNKEQYSTEKPGEGWLKEGQDIRGGGATTSGEKNITILDVDTDQTKVVDDSCNSCLGSPWYHVEHRDASLDSESDGAEEISDASLLANAAPVLDELEPLVSKDNSDDGSAANHVLDDGSAEEEAENHDEEDDEEAQEENDDGNKVAITWTADDQRNLMDLGDSELERNRRLENLIAKRRARKAMGKNLIDLDDNMDMSHLPSINAPRWNPFDLPYDEDDFPESAPSILLPRRNLFHLSYGKVDDEENSGHKDHVAPPQRDMLFRRHESFTIGAPFFGDFRQDQRRASRFKFFFGDENNDPEVAALHRLLSEVNDSKSSPTLESDAVSGITTQEHEKDLGESPIKLNLGAAELDSQSSDGVESVNVEHVESQMNVDNDHDDTPPSNSIASEHSEDMGGAAESDTSKELVVTDAPISYAERAQEVIEEEYENSSCTPSEAEKQSPIMSTPEQTTDLEQINGGSETVSLEVIGVDSDAVNVEAEQVHDSHVVEPVYVSSPKAIIKSRTNSILDEALDIADKGDSTHNQPLASDVNESLPGAGSPTKTAETDILSGGETKESSSLAVIDEENESASRGMPVMKEPDAIGDEMSRVHEDLGGPISPVVAEPAAGRESTPHSDLSAKEVESKEDS